MKKMQTKTFIALIGLLLGVTSIHAGPGNPTVEGKTIFMSRCASCHNVNKVMTGPALAGVDERHSIEWIVNFVHSSQTMVKKGDKEAIALFEKFNRIPMPDHRDLTADNIKSIVEFIRSESERAEKKTDVERSPGKRSDVLSFSIEKSFWPLLGVLVSFILLIATIVFAIKVRSMVRRFKENKLASNA